MTGKLDYGTRLDELALAEEARIHRGARSAQKDDAEGISSEKELPSVERDGPRHVEVARVGNVPANVTSHPWGASNARCHVSSIYMSGFYNISAIGIFLA